MRRAFVAAGLLLLAALWMGPLPRLAAGSFSAHMTLHMGVVALAAPLLALGLGRRPALIPALPASLLELVVVWAWHAPVPHHAARQGGAALIAEQGMFLVAGLLLWLAAFHRPGAGVVALLLTSMHMTLLGALLALATRPLYGHAALEDQQLGGAIMLLAGGASYLLGGLWLAACLLRRPVAERA